MLTPNEPMCLGINWGTRIEGFNAFEVTISVLKVWDYPYRKNKREEMQQKGMPIPTCINNIQQQGKFKISINKWWRQLHAKHNFRRVPTLPTYSWNNNSINHLGIYLKVIVTFCILHVCTTYWSSGCDSSSLLVLHVSSLKKNNFKFNPVYWWNSTVWGIN